MWEMYGPVLNALFIDALTALDRLALIAQVHVPRGPATPLPRGTNWKLLLLVVGWGRTGGAGWSASAK
jgi:hypothetical protein